jgi:hypothetical protein
VWTRNLIHRSRRVKVVNIAIELPDDVARHLEARGGNLPRRALEALALEAYRSGEITEAEVQQMLHMSSRWEAEAFLKRTQAYLDYSEADLERDIAAIRQALTR